MTAFITRLPGSWRTTAFRSLMWPVDDIFILPGVITSLCLDTVSARMGVGHSLLPTQLPGTHWHLALTVSDVFLKLGCFQRTSIYSRLEVLHFMRCINSRLTYLLTYWLLWPILTTNFQEITEPVLGSSSMTASVRKPLMSDRWLFSMFDSLKRRRNVPHGESYNLCLASSFEMNP